MTPTQILAANTTAAVFPRTFKTAAGRQFITPRVRKQTDRGRDWLDSLDQDSFEGPQGAQWACLEAHVLRIYCQTMFFDPM